MSKLQKKSPDSAPEGREKTAPGTVLKNKALSVVIVLLFAAVIFLAGYTVRGYVGFFSENTASVEKNGTSDAGLSSGKNENGAAGGVAAENGADGSEVTENGTTENGTTEDGAAGSGAAENGTTENGTAEGEVPESRPEEKAYIPEINIGSFSALSFSGESFSEKKLSDCSVNLINIWATFCSPCIREMPDLEEISKEYAGRVQVIGLCADTSDKGGNTDTELFELGKSIALEDLSLTYINLVPDEKLQKGILADVFAYPTTLITDSEGNILEIIEGRRSKEEFLSYLNRYLKADENGG